MPPVTKNILRASAGDEVVKFINDNNNCNQVRSQNLSAGDRQAEADLAVLLKLWPSSKTYEN